MRTKTSVTIAAIAVVVVLFGSFIAFNDGDDGDGSFVILHSNDTHCYLGDDGNLGFSTLKSLKDEKLSEGKTVFVIDAGDFIQGNVYGMMTEGEAGVEVMNEVGYDVGIPGNHEFDYGFDTFVERMSELDYPIICANLIYGSTGESVFPEYTILERNGVRLGCFGLLTPDTELTTMKGNMGDSKITDPISAATRMVDTLDDMDVDCIVCIGHMGIVTKYSVTSDYICSVVPGIDIFIDGHSHTEMEDGKVCDGSKELLPSDTLIASTGSYCKAFGVLSVDSDGDMSAKLYRGEALPDATIDAIVHDIHDEVDKILAEVVGSTTITLDGERDHVRRGETNLGDLIADALRNCTSTDIGIINGGGVRTSIGAGDITLKDIYNVMPFMNEIVTITVTGEDLYTAMDYSLSRPGESFGGFLQVSGMKVTYDQTKGEGSRIVSMTVDGKDVERGSSYTVTIPNFLTEGGDGHTAFVGKPTEPAGFDSEIFKAYLESIGPIDESKIEGDRLISV